MQVAPPHPPLLLQLQAAAAAAAVVVRIFSPANLLQLLLMTGPLSGQACMGEAC